jgi:hypothetical protein
MSATIICDLSTGEVVVNGDDAMVKVVKKFRKQIQEAVMQPSADAAADLRIGLYFMPLVLSISISIFN